MLRKLVSLFPRNIHINKLVSDKVLHNYLLLTVGIDKKLFRSTEHLQFAFRNLNYTMPPKGKKKVEKEEVPDHELSESGSDSEPETKKSKAKPKPKPKKNEDKKERGTKRKKEGKEEGPAKKTKVELTKADLKDLNFDCDKSTPSGEKWNFKITTWNVAGLRAWIKKGGIDYVKKEDPDILCLQETKCREDQVPTEAKVPGYHMHWVNGVKDGYAGVALYSKIKPISVVKGLNNKEHDVEGRVITAEYEQFYLVTTYVPNAGQGLKTLPKRLKWDEDFRNYLKELDAKKPVILCGDLNVAHTEIDLANPKTNTKNAGFTPEEREGMTVLLKEGFVDTFRHLYPDLTGAYTFWAYFNNARARNTGWRLDYFIFSERFMPHLCDNVIRNQVHGSDHCPVTVFVHI